LVPASFRGNELMSKILLVEDNDDLRESLKIWIQKEGFNLEVCSDGESGLELMAMSEFDAIILDWQLPGISGIDLLRRYRMNGGNAPVIFLTGKNEVDDKITGLDGGADDYLTKPFKMQELTARLKALLRRNRDIVESVITFGDLQLDPGSRSLRRKDEELKLPPREFALLEFLMRHKAETFPANALLRHVWSSDSQATDQTVRTCVKRVRQVIDIPGQDSYIDNIHGHGYRMNFEVLKKQS
jgi:DNA-binding response OmpR family regulator